MIVYKLGSRPRFRFSLILLLVLSSFCVRADEQTHQVYRIAFVGANSASTFPRSVAALRDRLRELGYVDTHTVLHP